MASRSNGFSFGPGELGRSLKETLGTLPGRVRTRSRLDDMSTEEKDFAHFSNEVYTAPADRRTEIRGYTLLQDKIRGGKTAAPLNDQRWAVYRAPNRLDHVLVFRGTAGWEDIVHDIQLMAGFGEHRYMMEAAVWSMRVMLFLVEQHADRGPKRDTCLKFRVAGHSLGGAVGMGVMLLLHNIPDVTDLLQRNARKRENHGLASFFSTFKEDVADPWYDVIGRRGTDACYEFGGGHIFNPGAFPRLKRKGKPSICDKGNGLVVELGLYVTLSLLKECCAIDDSSVDKQVTTHHVLGDILSCSFRLGTEKSYLTRGSSWETGKKPFAKIRRWRPHSLTNFLR